MSSIGSVGSADISQFLRGIGNNNSSTDRASSKRPEPTAEMKQQFESKFKDTANSLGLDGDKLSTIGSQVREAIDNVRKNSDGQSPSDTKSAIDSAVNDVLKKNGIDKTEFDSEMKQVMDKMGGPKGGQGGFGPPPGASGSSPSSSSSSTQQQQLLQQLLGSSTSGNSTASFFTSAPAGTFVDAAA